MERSREQTGVPTDEITKALQRAELRLEIFDAYFLAELAGDEPDLAKIRNLYLQRPDLFIRLPEEVLEMDINVAKRFASGQVEIRGNNVGLNWLIIEEQGWLRQLEDQLFVMSASVPRSAGRFTR